MTDQGGDLALLRGKAHIPQDRLILLVGKSDVFKGNIITRRTEFRRSGLGRVLRDLVHPPHGDGQQVQHAQIDQVGAHGLIQAGSRQQEGKELHDVQPPLQKQHASDQGHRADPDPQNQLGRNDEGRLAQLRTNGLFLHVVDPAVQLGQVSVLGVAAFQVPGQLDKLLHGVVEPHLGFRLTADEMGLHPS